MDIKTLWKEMGEKILELEKISQWIFDVPDEVKERVLHPDPDIINMDGTKFRGINLYEVSGRIMICRSDLKIAKKTISTLIQWD